MGIEEHVALRCPCCDATDVDTRHARICTTAGAQVNQHQPLFHATSRILKRLGVPHQVESGEPFTADRNLRMDIVVRKGGLRNAPNPEYRDKSILVGVAHAKPQAQVNLQAGSALIMMDQLPLLVRRASANTTLDRDMSPSTNGAINYLVSTFAVESCGRLGVEGSYFIDQLATSVVGGMDGGSMARTGVLKECLLQIVPVTTQVAIRGGCLASSYSLEIARMQEGVRGREDDGPTLMAWGWSMDAE